MARDKNLRIRRNTAANAASSNPVLDAGEVGYETDTKRLKVGDGATAWTSLPEVGTGTYAPIDTAGFRTWVAGRYYGSAPQAPGTLVVGDGLITATPFWVPKALTVSAIACEVTTGAASSAVRLGIYASNANDQPAALMIDAGTSSAVALGVKEIAITQALTPGLYWLACVSQGGAPTLRTVGTGALPPVAADSFAGSQASTGMNCYYLTGVSGALAAWSSWAGVGSSGTKVMLKAA